MSYIDLWIPNSLHDFLIEEASKGSMGLNDKILDILHNYRKEKQNG